MQVQRINTIAELQAEQDRLTGNMRHTRAAFQRSASETTTGGRDFLLHKVLIPVGAIGLGIFAAKKIADAMNAPKDDYEYEEAEYSTNWDNGDTNSYNESPSSFKDSNSYNGGSHRELGRSRSSDNWFPKLMLVALPVLQQFFLSEQADENAEGAAEGTHLHHKTNLQEKGVKGFVSALVPMVIPMAQQHFLKKSEEADKRTVVMDEYGTPHKSSAAGIFDSLYKMLPVVLPLIQQYFGAGTTVVKDEKATASKNEHYAGAIA